MNDQMFQVMQSRFDRIEEIMLEHIKEDQKAHKKVERHEVYWKITTWFTGSAILAAIGAFFGLKTH